MVRTWRKNWWTILLVLLGILIQKTKPKRKRGAVNRNCTLEDWGAGWGVFLAFWLNKIDERLIWKSKTLIVRGVKKKTGEQEQESKNWETGVPIPVPVWKNQKPGTPIPVSSFWYPIFIELPRTELNIYIFILFYFF